jgi:hypothetical protein
VVACSRKPGKAMVRLVPIVFQANVAHERKFHAQKLVPA